MVNNNYRSIQDCKRLIEIMGRKIDWMDNDVIAVDDGLWQVAYSDDCPDDILLNFHVETCSVMVTSITKRFSFLASMIGMDIVIGEVYAFEFDDDGKFKEIIFGSDAYKTIGREYYFGLKR